MKAKLIAGLLAGVGYFAIAPEASAQDYGCDPYAGGYSYTYPQYNTYGNGYSYSYGNRYGGSHYRRGYSWGGHSYGYRPYSYSYRTYVAPRYGYSYGYRYRSGCGW